MKIYRLAISFGRETLKLFCEKYNINLEEVHYLGGGDFGEAYEHKENVIKITTDKTEYNFSKELVGYQNKPIAKIKLVDEIKNDYFILMEKVEQKQEIENMFYEIERLAEENDSGIEYLDLDDIDNISPELKEFGDSLQWIYDFQRRLGIQRADIKPENLGYNKEGELVCFDISDFYK